MGNGEAGVSGGADRKSTQAELGVAILRDRLGVSMCRSFVEGLIGFGGIGEGNMFHLSELLVISRNYDDRIVIYKNAIIGFSYFRQCDPSVSREVGTKYCKSIGRSCESLKF